MNDFFLVACLEDFIENARLFIFETFCRIHQCISIRLATIPNPNKVKLVSSCKFLLGYTALKAFFGTEIQTLDCMLVECFLSFVRSFVLSFFFFCCYSWIFKAVDKQEIRNFTL